MKIDPVIVKRFWSKVHKTPTCWNWTGSTRNGYGTFWARIGSNHSRTHRLSWMIHRGPIPNGMQVLHHCDNKKCVRPSHLWLGTNADNVRDKMQKGRYQNQKGEQNGNCILRAEDVLKIRMLHKSGMRWWEIAKQFPQIRPDSVRPILSGQRWKHITCF